MPATTSPSSRRVRLISGLSALPAHGPTAGFLVATGQEASAATAGKVDYSVNRWSVGPARPIGASGSTVDSDVDDQFAQLVTNAYPPVQ